MYARRSGRHWDIGENDIVSLAHYPIFDPKLLDMEAPAPPWASRARSFSKAPPLALSPFLMKASKGAMGRAMTMRPPTTAHQYCPKPIARAVTRQTRHEEEDETEGLDGLGQTSEEVQEFVHGLPHSTPTARAAVRISLMSEPQRRNVRR